MLFPPSGRSSPAVLAPDFEAEALTQPAVKCRGREYLRIVYGPEHTDEENLGRSRKGLLAMKRSLMLREFPLEIEALQRFVRRERLCRVRECFVGVLAIESELVSPDSDFRSVPPASRIAATPAVQ